MEIIVIKILIVWLLASGIYGLLTSYETGFDLFLDICKVILQAFAWAMLVIAVICGITYLVSA